MSEFDLSLCAPTEYTHPALAVILEAIGMYNLLLAKLKQHGEPLHSQAGFSTEIRRSGLPSIRMSLYVSMPSDGPVHAGVALAFTPTHQTGSDVQIHFEAASAHVESENMDEPWLFAFGQERPQAFFYLTYPKDKGIAIVDAMLEKYAELAKGLSVSQ